MPINLQNPITKPATSEATYDQVYLKRLVIVSETPTSSFAHARFVPFNSETGEIDEDTQIEMRVPGPQAEDPETGEKTGPTTIQELAATKPAVAQAFGALLNALSDEAEDQGVL